jgi:hypothetical protein
MILQGLSDTWPVAQHIDAVSGEFSRRPNPGKLKQLR